MFSMLLALGEARNQMFVSLHTRRLRRHFSGSKLIQAVSADRERDEDLEKDKRRGFTLVFERKRFSTGVSAWQTGKRFALTNFVLIPKP